jgi:hypothetical protein
MSLTPTLTHPYDHTPGDDPNRPDSVNRQLTPKRPRRPVENDEYAAFARRVLRAYSRRVAHGDIDALEDMADLAAEISTTMGNAVAGLRERGYSWAEIGLRVHITRQAAQQRWGRSE